MNSWVELFAVFALRALQAGALCLPTLLCGMLVAGVLRVLIGEVRVRRWLASHWAGDLIRAWGLGVLMPVGAMGVLPVLLTLRRMGIPRGPILVVALTGPLVTPWTLGYLADRCGPGPAMLLILVNGLVALAVGAWVGRRRASHDVASAEGRLIEEPYQASDVVPHTQNLHTDTGVYARSNARSGARFEARPVTASSQLMGTLQAAGRSLDGLTLRIITVGLAGAGLLAVMIPPNLVGDWLVERTALHAVVLGAMAVFTTVTPETAAMQAGEILHSGNMPGLIVPLIGLGSAVHLGLLLAAWRWLGWRRATTTLVLTLLLTAAAGGGVGALVRGPQRAMEDSHAFEDYGRPFHLLDHPAGPMAGFWAFFIRPLGMNTFCAGIAVALLAIGARLPQHKQRATAGRRRTLRPLSPPQFRLASIAVGLAVPVLAISSYYPAPPALADELRGASAAFNVAYLRGDDTEARQQSRRIDRRLGQLPVVAVLHLSPLDNDQRHRTADLRTRLALLTSQISARPPERAASLQFQIALVALLRTFR